VDDLYVVQEMTKTEEIAEVFCIFHDGTIAGGSEIGFTADLVVEIQYLAERIRPTDQTFTMRIDNLEHVKFSPWMDVGYPSIPQITSITEILLLNLEVLSAEADGPKVKIACNQPRRELGYCGGLLEFAAGGCRVFDESGREWALDELRRLSDDYWRDWAARSKNAQQDGTSNGG
jgi:hypothetical protein